MKTSKWILRVILGILVSSQEAQALSGGPYDDPRYRPVTPPPTPAPVPRNNSWVPLWIQQQAILRQQQYNAWLQQQQYNEWLRQQQIAAQRRTSQSRNLLRSGQSITVLKVLPNCMPARCTVSRESFYKAPRPVVQAPVQSTPKQTVMQRLGTDNQGRPTYYFSPLPTYPMRFLSEGYSEPLDENNTRMRTQVFSDARGVIYQCMEPVVLQP